MADVTDQNSGAEPLSEADEWALLTPAQRWLEYDKLWAIYLGWGGSLDPQPDSQSPFDCEELERAVPGHGRPGVRIIRRGGV
jgi:hypothetical protein